MVIALVVLLVFITVGAGGGYVVNQSLSAQYSPERTATDYFAAQVRGDVPGMMSNATYLRGDGTYSQYFDQDGITQMLAIPQNRAISNVKVMTSQKIDDSTSDVTLSMTWADSHRTHLYRVTRDPSRVHDLFYYSWRIQIPSVTIRISLPIQPGPIVVDNVAPPSGSPQGTVTLIEGYHKITMQSTDFYDSADRIVDGVDTSPLVTFDGTLSSLATDAAKAAVRTAFNNCDVSKITDCLNHTYHAPIKANTFYFFNMPGYGEVDYTRYVFTLRGDPAADIKLAITTDVGMLSASGSCAVTMTVDGSRKYNFTGSWATVLSATGGGFTGDVFANCEEKKG